MKIDLAQDARATIGEGPVWDERAGRLCWVDIAAGIVHRWSPQGGDDRVLDVGQPVGSLALGAQGGIVLAVRDGFALVPRGAERVAATVDVERELTGNRMNDGRCDVAGRFWAGTMDRDHRPHAGSLYRLDAASGTLAVTRVITGVTISNGIDWSPRDDLMYFVDSQTQRVDVFDFDAVSGALVGRRPFVEIPAADGLPDGIAVDGDGCVWVALFGAGAVRRYSPSGRIDRVVRLPVTLVTSVAFGGADLSDLYITTARHRLTPQERVRQTHAGGLFVCRPGPGGRPAHRFGWV